MVSDSRLISATHMTRNVFHRVPRFFQFITTRFVRIAVFLVVLSQSGPAETAEAPVEDRIDFKIAVLPILVKACFSCHGPEGESPKANLHLDEESLLRVRNGRPALVVPEQPDESELLRRIGSMDLMVRMPPESAGPPLSAEEIAVIRKWIEQPAPGHKNGSVRVTQRASSPRSNADRPRPQPSSLATEASPKMFSEAATSAPTQGAIRSSIGAGNDRSTLIVLSMNAILDTFPVLRTDHSRSRPTNHSVWFQAANSSSSVWPIAMGRSGASTAPTAAFQLIQDISRAAFSALIPEIAEPASELQLTLPPVAYAVVGSPMGVDFDNLILVEDPSAYRFVVESPLGSTSATRWSLTASLKEIGNHPWKIEIWKDDVLIAQKSMTWRVSPATGGTRSSVSLLLIGDSLTHATEYPNELAQRLSRPGQPQWTMLGTHHTEWALPGVVHEGYGGWTWDAFVRRYALETEPTTRKNVSPFVFVRNSRPQLDVARYLAELPGGGTPDYVFFMLGINDCFSINPDNPEAADEHIDNVFESAETLIAEFRKAVPHAELAIGLTTPPNSRQTAFEANYGTRMTRWRWKRIQHHFVQRQIAQFRDREHEHIYIVPTELNLDPVAGFPVNNAVHPNTSGYSQIAASLHAWLTARWHAK